MDVQPKTGHYTNTAEFSGSHTNNKRQTSLETSRINLTITHRMRKKERRNKENTT